MSNYIYHYTTIENLALILENKTLRLNSLAHVDDMQEGLVNTSKNMSKHLYVSCWTKNENENIALWNMYSKNMKGIRIGIKKSKIVDIKGKDNNIINIENNDEVFAIYFGDFLKDVEYIKNPKVKLFLDDTSLSGDIFTGLGKYKSEIWSFQEESRFILWALPFKTIEESKHIKLYKDNINIGFIQEFLLNPEAKTNINYIDLKLENDVWENAEIILGPNSSDSDKIILDALISKYCPTSRISILKSKLNIRIK